MTLVEGAIDDESERTAALAALAELSLVKHDPFEDGGTPAVTVHRLVQAVARARSERKARGAERFRAPDRTACGGLSGRWLSQPASWLRLCAAHAASPCELRKRYG